MTLKWNLKRSQSEPKWVQSETKVTLKWNQSDLKVKPRWPKWLYRLLYTCCWLAILVLFMLYEFTIVWWPTLLLLMLHVTASQLFVNCWVRATASIVRAKRCYFDDILNNFLGYTLFFFSSSVLLSSSSLPFFLCLFFSLFSLHIHVGSGCNRKQRFPFIARTDL